VSDLYDRHGQPIGLDLWLELYLSDSYRVVLMTQVNTHVVVSTVWTGVDARVLNRCGQPLVFETAVFQDGRVEATLRNATEGEARAAHVCLVNQLTAH
jgi:hypothetical protein